MYGGAALCLEDLNVCSAVDVVMVFQLPGSLRDREISSITGVSGSVRFKEKKMTVFRGKGRGGGPYIKKLRKKWSKEYEYYDP